MSSDDDEAIRQSFFTNSGRYEMMFLVAWRNGE